MTFAYDHGVLCDLSSICYNCAVGFFYQPSPSWLSRVTYCSFPSARLFSSLHWVGPPLFGLKMTSQALLQLNFDIDRYLNPFLPPSQIHHFPRPISRFLGHRESSRPNVGNIVSLIWSFVGAFSGIALIAGVFRASSVIHHTGAPIIIGSFVSECSQSDPWRWNSLVEADQ